MSRVEEAAYVSPAVYGQRRVERNFAPPGACAPYTRPLPTTVQTNLITPAVVRIADFVPTNLCSQVT